MIFDLGAGGATDADKIKYDNSKSNLNATDVQGAVDELDESLGEDVNGMTVHEKLDYIMENSKPKELTILDVQLNSSANGKSPESVSSSGTLYVSNSGSNSFIIDTTNFTTLTIGTISGSVTTITVNDVTKSSHEVVDLTGIDKVTISASVSNSTSAPTWSGTGANTTCSANCLISQLTFS